MCILSYWSQYFLVFCLYSAMSVLPWVSSCQSSPDQPRTALLWLVVKASHNTLLLAAKNRSHLLHVYIVGLPYLLAAYFLLQVAPFSLLQNCTVRYPEKNIYSVSPKNPPWGYLNFFSFFHKRLKFFHPTLTHLLHVPMYARLQIFVQLSPTLTKLCHIKRDYLVHIICTKCQKQARSYVCVSRW